ncbi:MAG: enoyl-CoA hydratase [Dongiaceae bacterium]
MSDDASDRLLLREDKAGICRLTLNRPQARNALSLALLDRLAEELEEIAGNNTVRVVVIAGAGSAFCAGHDLKELRANQDDAFHQRVFQHCSDVMLRLTNLPQPVIAEVHGIATAAGCQLVATCDLAIADSDAHFATPGVNIGLFCSTPMVALSRAVSRKAAMEMLLAGDMIDADRAQALGLINRSVPAGQLTSTVETLARRIADKSSHVLAIGKKAFYAQAELGLAAAYAYTSDVMVRNLASLDAAEGIDAFIAKRKPVWCGC